MSHLPNSPDVMSRNHADSVCCDLGKSAMIPPRLYLLLSIIFRVKRHDTDKCIVGRVVYVFTVLVALMYGVLDLVYTVYDVRSDKTMETTSTGAFHMVITVLWCSLGVYANLLSHRLLRKASFVNTMQMHSKTIFKIPAVVLLSVMAMIVIGATNYKAFSLWQPETCDRLQLNVWVCRLTYIFMNVQSILLLIFNMCIAAAVLSICRTHTFGLRRFIRDLENDGKACEVHHRQRFMKLDFSASHSLNGIYLMEQCYDDRVTEDEDDEPDAADSSTLRLVPKSIKHLGAADSAQAESDRHTIHDSHNRILSRDDILFSYWKLAKRMRMTSRSLQRWLASWIVFTILWLLRLILAWLNHPATYLEITQFLVPLLMLIVICTAYGEANGEASRVISSITPLQDRLDILRSLPHIQLAMSLYNHNLTYSSIVTVVAALGLALSSRIIMDEFLTPSNH